jgi:hypothetical protein
MDIKKTPIQKVQKKSAALAVRAQLKIQYTKLWCDEKFVYHLESAYTN